ncbi:MAG: phosphoribosylglycinamide synthetase C domain-containing protein, partial [Limnochordia bacterium]
TAGGRAFLLGAKGKTISEAREKVYAELAKVECSGIFYRRDIGLRAVASTEYEKSPKSLVR